MFINEEQRLEMIAYEAFIRRASQLDMPFILKGSYVTRQYFDDPMDRMPVDLDWVCMIPIPDEKVANEALTKWATLVTEMQWLEDKTEFNSFRKNAFWRMIEYAMRDDFPTVNTDLIARVEGKEIELYVDVSFNKKVDFQSVPLLYRPIYGEPFVVQYSAPLSLQVSWKMHQTIVRPRFKDIFDLTYLLKHIDFDEKTRQECLQALVNECFDDNVKTKEIRKLFNYEIRKLYGTSSYLNESIEDDWGSWWAVPNATVGHEYLHYNNVRGITNPKNVSQDLDTFIDTFIEAMKSAGFGPETMKNLPKPYPKKKSKFGKWINSK
jgi:hypothetical protein